jgi:CRISPR-associated endonuclease/helicase Cas3
MTLATSDFGAFHAAVHGGRPPFSWQQRLLEQIVCEKRWPRVLDLPTGAGKTTCIDIAVFTLALDAYTGAEQRWCPRRIVMVVDRRVVVDQVAERGRAILNALVTSGNTVVTEVARRLRSLTRTCEEPLGVFTLRGGMPKDDGWARTPDQPLVVASTVDQVGSRLLMQGYGVSQCMKPVHAGLLANDTLLLLDEVHLSEPFRQTLDQLAGLRARFAKNGLTTRFAHSFLSATPGVGNDAPFTLLNEERSRESPLGARLHASKPVILIEVEDRSSLNRVCIAQTEALLQRHRTVAVVVNRLGSASAIARALTESLAGVAAVTLITGRMRPLDRDDLLRELRPAVETGRVRRDDLPRRVVVGTQCIEAGADFDFDAIVTEAASLDSLRQRFGRVDRLGAYQQAEGVIVYDNCRVLRDELKLTGDKPSHADEDPIYGKALGETVKWLKEQQKERPKKLKAELKQLQEKAKTLKGEARQLADAELARKALVDFGILALELPTADVLATLLAPKSDAPTLLPAYLDLWAQTWPAPQQVPDVSLWLHGPASAPPDVQVVWRADLSAEVLHAGDVETATAIVSSVRPSTLEAVSLPFATACAWLAGKVFVELGDTEGQTHGDGTSSDTLGQPALRWAGDESAIVFARADEGNSIRPGDTIVVPASYGGICSGCFDPSSTAPVSDRAEQAAFFARARPTLRLHPAIAAELGLELPLDEPTDSRAVLRRLSSNQDWPAWKRLWARKLSAGREALVVLGEAAWTVIEARRLPPAALREVLRPEETVEDGVELTTDGDDSFFAGRAVSLSEHSADVESFARAYAERCGLGPWLAAHVAMAAWLHDIGKADPRFQILLKGGSEIEFFKDATLLAKSAMPPAAREVQRLAQRKSGYPRGARHEVQSVAMLQAQLDAVMARLTKVDATKKPDLDLLLHLVASHHGYCRPFAPAVVDETPVEVTLAGHTSPTFGTIDFASTLSSNGLHRLDSPLADRFWGLLAKYGWQELCWLETILRLADHRASEEEQRGGGSL